jgi:hypothetical protein
MNWRRSTRGFAIAASCIIFAQAASAQTPDTARVGQRVRVTLDKDTTAGHPRQMLFGNLISKTQDSLGIQLGGGASLLKIPVSSVDKLHVSRGVPTREQSAIGGAIGGAVVGAGFGVVLMFVSDANAWDLIKHMFMDSALGAGLGALMPQESWKSVKR